MTVEQAKLFLDALKTDAALQEKVQEANIAYLANTLLPIAKEAGFDFTLDELQSLQNQNAELDGADLEMVAGGLALDNNHLGRRFG